VKIFSSQTSNDSGKGELADAQQNAENTVSEGRHSDSDVELMCCLLVRYENYFLELRKLCDRS